MNNEIKEILDDLGNDNIEKPFGMATIDKHKLLDYITNLQQENERLQEIINDNMTVYLKGLEDGKEKMKQCFESIYKSRCEKVINDINRYLDARKIINDNTKYYYTNEFYKRPIKSNIAYLFNDYLQYLKYLLEGDNHDPN